MKKFTKRSNAIAAIVLQLNFQVGKAGFELSERIASITRKNRSAALLLQDIQDAVHDYEVEVELLRVGAQDELEKLNNVRFDDEINGTQRKSA